MISPLAAEPRLAFLRTGPASGIITLDARAVAEIADLELRNVRFHAGGAALAGVDAGIPLYWRQYHHHEDPERSARGEARVEDIDTGEALLRLRCHGSTASGAARSMTDLVVEAFADGRIEYHLFAALEIAPGAEWRVTPHPQHGELEFLNLWPSGVFLPGGDERKRYDACVVVRGDTVTRIPHTHLESADKHDIRLLPGDVFCYLLEADNPAVQILDGAEISAGLCAYMWDAHFAVRLCHGAEDVLLRSPRRITAAVRLFSIDVERARELAAAAEDDPAAGNDGAPIYVHGVNSFAETIASIDGDAADVWPWSHETTDSAHARGDVDRAEGHADDSSLRIVHQEATVSRWVATTLGPAYGDPPFVDGARYRLSAWVRADAVNGAARIALRVHREGAEDLFDVHTYEVFGSETQLDGTTPWTRLVVETPAISPPPDRVHLLLELEGSGICRFDDVLFEQEHRA
ncbi:MAG: hypothetical protein IPP94_11690 [Ignavibacteria bacterium]|nr:hypothetical protein [Ignavibacteria bacterium]